MRFAPAIRADCLEVLVGLVEEGGDSAALQRRLLAFADLIERQLELGGLAERAAVLVLADLARQGWEVFLDGGEVWVSAVEGQVGAAERVEEAKGRVRETLRAFRDLQLSDPAVRAFLRAMEQPRVFHGGRVSILDLVDDGHEVAMRLGDASRLPPSERARALESIVRPVIQVAAPDAVCEHTGLGLYDIWRYFRHTWSLEYRPTPGRSLAFLVRNAARPHAPVMGIASIANAALQLKVRDDWIGWSTAEVVSALRAHPEGWSEQRAELLSAARLARAQVRDDDLLRSAGKAQGEELERRLWAIAAAARADRARGLEQRSARIKQGEQVGSLRALPLDGKGGVDWRAASERPLFVAKRAETLANLLFAIRMIEELPEDPRRAAEIVSARKDARRALTVAAREVRKVGLSSRLLDVNVCGAVQPYRDLLVGKLVALAMASREVTQAYRERYRGQPSEIASQLAGRPISREPDICLLTTTSLYGAAASQYNRLKVDVALARGGTSRVHWRDLGLTEGWGTTHFSEPTVAAFRQLVVLVRGRRTVNNQFGEGQSPRLRQVREGLEILGLDPEVYLRHRHSRRVYGLELAPGARDVLRLNRAAASERPPFDAIARAWRERWLDKRAQRADVRRRVAEQGPRSVRAELSAPERGPQMELFSRATISARSVVEWEGMMAEQSNPALIQGLYRSLGACADHHSDATVALLHVATPIDDVIRERAAGRVLFVTGNPGDGKTHVLRRLAPDLKAARVEVCLDATERPNDELIEQIQQALRSRTRGLAIAINEGILVQLLRTAAELPWSAGVRRQLMSPFV
ncbi:MAG: DUF4338 domain-containing protein, partial [Sandaracinaceae bacterium]|nr:DUF4338 domain-containing protein [Sandaracinaceae bacterium]